MPKILRIINRFNLGGPTYNVAYLTKHLEGEFETLLVGGPKEESEESSGFILENLDIHPVIIPEMKRSINMKDDYIAYRALRNLIREFKPDIVHTHASKAGTLGRLAARAEKVPNVVHTFHGHVFHSYFGKIQSGFYKNIERYLAGKTDAIIAISEKQKEELCAVHKICEPGKISVIPLGFDLSRFNESKETKRRFFREKYSITEDEVVITIIGRLVPVKNHRLFLDSIKLAIEKSGKKIRAFIVGDGEEKENLFNYCRSISLPFATPEQHVVSPVTFTSWIREADIVCAASDIVALTSYNEGTPVSLIEAQAAGVPVISTPAGGVENVLIHGETGILSSAENFTENLILLIKNEEQRRIMSDKGWNAVSEKYHYTRLISDTSKLYKSLLER